jgi:hypothetical protein
MTTFNAPLTRDVLDYIAGHPQEWELRSSPAALTPREDVIRAERIELLTRAAERARAREMWWLRRRFERAITDVVQGSVLTAALLTLTEAREFTG